MKRRNVAASVRARLLARARETRQDFNLVLTRYALERLLYRISVSPHAGPFLERIDLRLYPWKTLWRRFGTFFCQLSRQRDLARTTRGIGRLGGRGLAVTIKQDAR